MKKTLLVSLAAAALLFAVAGCSGGEEPYVIEGPSADHPSVAGTASSDGGQSTAAKPAAPAAPTKAGR